MASDKCDKCGNKFVVNSTTNPSHEILNVRIPFSRKIEVSDLILSCDSKKNECLLTPYFPIENTNFSVRFGYGNTVAIFVEGTSEWRKFLQKSKVSLLVKIFHNEIFSEQLVSVWPSDKRDWVFYNLCLLSTMNKSSYFQIIIMADEKFT